MEGQAVTLTCALIVIALANDNITARSMERMPHCGVAAVYGIAKLCGHDISPGDIEASILRRAPGANLSALSLKQLRDALEDLGLKAQAFKSPPEGFGSLPTPSIAYFRPERLRHSDGVGHVVILTSVTSTGVRVLDLTQSRVPIDIPMSEFSEGWDGEYISVYKASQIPASAYFSASIRSGLWLSVIVGSLIAFFCSVRYRFRQS